MYVCAIFSCGGPQGSASFPLRFTGQMGRAGGGVGGEKRYRKRERKRFSGRTWWECFRRIPQYVIPSSNLHFCPS